MSGSGDSGAVDNNVAEGGAEDQHHGQPEKSVAEDAAADGVEKLEPSVADDVEKLEPSAAESDKKLKLSAAESAEKLELSAADGAKKPVNKRLRYKEVTGDLFQCPDTSSMAHCVSKDLRMSKGIATLFKANFGRVNELVRQAKNVGECAVLQFPDRCIYYLITKKIYSHKPTYADLEASLVQMKEHCLENGVKELSMPKIACGLDRLHWNQVSDMIKEVFADVDISITIYFQARR